MAGEVHKPVVVVDYHKGNIQSVVGGLEAAGATVRVSDDPQVVAGASALVLPGVGAFEDAMTYLCASGLDKALVSALNDGAYFLGICLGLHLLFEQGSEASGRSDEPYWTRGLGIFEGSVTRLKSEVLKVPHVGWDEVYYTQNAYHCDMKKDMGKIEHSQNQSSICPLFEGVPNRSHFYFTHSYATFDDVPQDLIYATTYYTRPFAAAAVRDHIFGLQFHPEKSSQLGHIILTNFVNLVPAQSCAGVR